MSMIKTEQTTKTLSEQFEEACDLAAKLYAAGENTAEIDAEVERLMALLNEQA